MKQEIIYKVPEQSGFSQMFAKDKLTLGLFFAIESYTGAIPSEESG